MEGLLAACQAPAAQQEAVLRRLLALHRNTDILRRHGVVVPASWAADANSSGASASGTPPIPGPQPSVTGAATSSAADAAGGSDEPSAAALLSALPLTTYADYQPLTEAAMAAALAYKADDPATVAAHDAAVNRFTGASSASAVHSSPTSGERPTPVRRTSRMPPPYACTWCEHYLLWPSLQGHPPLLGTPQAGPPATQRSFRCARPWQPHSCRSVGWPQLQGARRLERGGCNSLPQRAAC